MDTIGSPRKDTAFSWMPVGAVVAGLVVGALTTYFWIDPQRTLAPCTLTPAKEGVKFEMVPKVTFVQVTPAGGASLCEFWGGYSTVSWITVKEPISGPVDGGYSVGARGESNMVLEAAGCREWDDNFTRPAWAREAWWDCPRSRSATVEVKQSLFLPGTEPAWNQVKVEQEGLRQPPGIQSVTCDKNGVDMSFKLEWRALEIQDQHDISIVPWVKIGEKPWKQAANLPLDATEIVGVVQVGSGEAVQFLLTLREGQDRVFFSKATAARRCP